MVDVKKEELPEYRVENFFAKPIDCEGFKIYPLTIAEIIEFDMLEYNRIIGILSLDKKEIEDTYKVFDINVYELVIVNFYNDDQFKDNVLRFFSKILKQEVVFHIDNYFLMGDKVIDQNNFYSIINIILQQNIIKRKPYQIKTKKEKDYFEMVKKAKEKYKKFLESENDYFLIDLISSVCAKHPSLNLFNIGKLTVYQLFDQFNRLSYIDEYFINIKSMLAGAEDIKLQHWSRKINF